MKTVVIKGLETPDGITMLIQRNPTADEMKQIERARELQDPKLMPNLNVPLNVLTAARWACSTAQVETVEKAADFLDLYAKLKKVPDTADRVSFEDAEYRLVRGELNSRAAKTWGFLSPIIMRAFDELTDE